ncbi:hypothetical protein DMI60_06310 [Escherichia coli]|nr:hypothetical protein [Escherichia coli]
MFRHYYSSKPKARYLPKRQCVNSQKEKYSSLSYKLSFVDVRNSYEYWRLKAHKHKKRLISYCFILTRI